MVLIVVVFNPVAWINSIVIICSIRAELYSNMVFSCAGLEYVITQLKSVVLSMGMIDRHLSVEQAVLLSRLEEEYQVEQWQNDFSINFFGTVANADIDHLSR